MKSTECTVQKSENEEMTDNLFGDESSVVSKLDLRTFASRYGGCVKTLLAIERKQRQEWRGMICKKRTKTKRK